MMFGLQKFLYRNTQIPVTIQRRDKQSRSIAQAVIEIFDVCNNPGSSKGVVMFSYVTVLNCKREIQKRHLTELITLLFRKETGKETW